MNRFISFYLIILTIILIFSLCFFIPVFSEYGLVATYNPNTSNLSLDISNSGLVWPTPRFYYNYFWFRL